MRQRELIILMLFLIFQSGTAQTVYRKIAVGFTLGKTLYVGDYGGNGLYDFGHSEFPQGYLSTGMLVSAYLSPSFDIGIQGNYGDYGYWNTALNNFLALKYEASVFAHYKFNNNYVFKENSRWSPFLSAGMGIAGYARNIIKDKGFYPRGTFIGIDFIIPVGFGVKYKISRELAIQYQYLYTFTDSDYHDQHMNGTDPFISNANDAWGEHLFSVIFSFKTSSFVKAQPWRLRYEPDNGWRSHNYAD